MTRKTVEINNLIREFSIKLAELCCENTTSVKVFVNCEGSTSDFNFKYADQLAKRGISMRNIKGDFIK